LNRRLDRRPESAPEPENGPEGTSPFGLPSSSCAPTLPRKRSQRDDGEPKVKNALTAQSNTVGHVAGHWCEAFAPFVFDKVEERIAGLAADLTTELRPRARRSWRRC
jgi:hypothetical protein